MATIGTFKKQGNGYTGEISTLSVQAKNVRLAFEENRSNDNSPQYRVLAGKAEIGAGWVKTSGEGRTYLSLKLDDPSFANPIFASLFQDESGEHHNLIWSRSSKLIRDAITHGLATRGDR